MSDGNERGWRQVQEETKTQKCKVTRHMAPTSHSRARNRTPLWPLRVLSTMLSHWLTGARLAHTFLKGLSETHWFNLKERMPTMGISDMAKLYQEIFGAIRTFGTLPNHCLGVIIFLVLSSLWKTITCFSVPLDLERCHICGLSESYNAHSVFFD